MYYASDLKEAKDGLVEGGKICTVLLSHCRIVNCASPVSTNSVVLDTHVEKGRGVVAEALIKCGKMQIGDCVVMGPTYRKVYEILRVCIWYMLTYRLRTFCCFKLSSFGHLLHSYADFPHAGKSHGESLG
jgi:hypothetical protein